MTIPYILIEKVHVCPCCVKFDWKFFSYFSAPGPIEYFSCDSKNIVFEDQTNLLKHFKTETRREESSTINQFHQIFYIWLSLYKYCSSFMSKNNINLCPSNLSSLNKTNVEEDNGDYFYPCQQCVTCGTFGIVTSRMDLSTLISVNNKQNNQYTCIHTSWCRNHLTNEKEIREGTEEERTLQLVDIQAFEDLVSRIHIPPTLVCSITNYVRISCSTLKITFKKLYNDSQFHKLKFFYKNMLELVFSFLILSDVKKRGDDSMFSKTGRFLTWSFTMRQN